MKDLIYCRENATVLCSEPWVAGETVEFMWMPAGISKICAGFRNGSIELTVNCDENTAANVQASLDAWRTERPKQEPFGCVEHREHEASVRVSAQQAFTFKDDGVYIAAEPTVLGAQNVNGRVHRSWSPSFTTDADYSQAKAIKTASGAVVMVFPEGVRGSRSNPAEITGVDFCVGTLTNKPAFHAMSPVKSSEGEMIQASGTSEGSKNGWENRRVGAESQSRYAGKMTQSAFGRDSTSGGHQLAKDSHESAAGLHETLSREAKGFGEDGAAEYHAAVAIGHRQQADYHGKMKMFHVGSESAKASDTINAHCRATLLQDIPDATAAEVACYEECVENGGDHNTAVLNIKSKREQDGVAASEVTADSIALNQQAALDKVNAMAESMGVARVTLDDVYDKVTAGAPIGNRNAAGKRSSTLSKQHAQKSDDYLKIAKAAKESGDKEKQVSYTASHKAHEASAKAWESGDKKSHAAAEAAQARASYLAFSPTEVSKHEKHAGEHMDAQERPVNGSEVLIEKDQLSLESIYARAGESR